MPLAIPVWYSYSPGGLVSVPTGQTTQKARAIAAAGRFSLCAQDETPPYKYVTVEGTAVIEPAELAERIAIARRYLGIEGGDAFIATGPARADRPALALTPAEFEPILGEPKAAPAAPKACHSFRSSSGRPARWRRNSGRTRRSPSWDQQ